MQGVRYLDHMSLSFEVPCIHVIYTVYSIEERDFASWHEADGCFEQTCQIYAICNLAFVYVLLLACPGV